MRAHLVLLMFGAVGAAPRAVDLPRQLQTPTWRPLTAYHGAIDWVLCDSPWAWFANFWLSESTSAAVLSFLASLLLPAAYELSCAPRA